MNARPFRPTQLVIALLVLATSCASSSGSMAPTSAASPADAPTTASNSTTGATDTPPSVETANTQLPATTASAAAERTYFANRDEAIQYLVNAWKFDNLLGAYQAADRTAVDNLFTQKAEGFELYGCDEGEFDTSVCNYRNQGANLNAQITAEKLAEGWQVTAVYMSTDG